MAFSVAIDHLVVSHPKLPGASTIVPADKTTLGPPKLKRNWEVRPGFGIDGAFCVYTGSGLATFDVTFEFWSEEKEPLWAQFAAIFLAAPSGRPDVLGVYHPALSLPPYYIDKVVVTELEGWSLVTPGRWQTRVGFLQHKPPKPFKPIKAEPTIPPVQKAAPPKVQTEQDIRLAKAAADFKAAGERGARGQ